jgi:hypothetical protein
MLPTVIRKPKTAEDVALGARLAKMQDRPIGPDDVARVLRAAGVEYVVVGAHAANGYTGRPRATVDVDVVVQHPGQAADAIAAAFPQLTVQDTPVVTRFNDEDHEAIDLMKPAGSQLWSRLLKDVREVRIGTEMVRIPSLEGVLAAKYAAMVSRFRRLPDKQQDGVDFLRIIEANAQVNEPLVSELAELVYPGGGREILKLIADARGQAAGVLTKSWFFGGHVHH